jgi:hypothetical protein
MPYQLSEGARATTLRAVRAMFPHDGLPDGVYAAVVDQLAADAAADPEIAATLDAGAAQFGGADPLDEAALRPHDGEPYLELIKAKAVVGIYDNPEVWRAFGYEGAAAHLGGYVHRGFDDLDWLPDPPIELDPSAGSHHA